MVTEKSMPLGSAGLVPRGTSLLRQTGATLLPLKMRHVGGKMGRNNALWKRQVSREGLAPKRGSLVCRAVSSPDAARPDVGLEASITIDNSCDECMTVIRLRGNGRPGLLASLTSTFIGLGLDVRKADISEKRGEIDDTFWVVAENGQKIDDGDISSVQSALEVALRSRARGRMRPKLTVKGAPEGRAELLHELMGTSCLLWYICRFKDVFL